MLARGHEAEIVTATRLEEGEPHAGSEWSAVQGVQVCRLHGRIGDRQRGPDQRPVDDRVSISRPPPVAPP